MTDTTKPNGDRDAAEKPTRRHSVVGKHVTARRAAEQPSISRLPGGITAGRVFRK